MSALGGILFFLGLGVGLVFGIILLIKAFQASTLWGLGFLFVPLVWLVFVATHWEESRRPFLRSLIGLPLMVIGIAIVGSQADRSKLSFETSEERASMSYSSEVDRESRRSEGGNVEQRGSGFTVSPGVSRSTRQKPDHGDRERAAAGSDPRARFEGLDLWDMEALVGDYPKDIGARYELAARQTAFGRWDSAVENLEQTFELVSQAAEADPDQPDLRVKVLEDPRFTALLSKRPGFKSALREAKGGITIDHAP